MGTASSRLLEDTRETDVRGVTALSPIRATHGGRAVTVVRIKSANARRDTNNSPTLPPSAQHNVQQGLGRTLRDFRWSATFGLTL
jgi:hypothetical protein